MEKVLVTGATGRLGMNLVKTLDRRKYKIMSFCYDSSAEKHLRDKLSKLDTEIILGDLSTGKGLDKAVKKADSIVHCAALMQEARAPREKFFDINTKGAFYLMEAARKHPVRRLVAITTGAVYDVLTAKPPYKEDKTELRPLGIYGMCKILNERLYVLYSFQFGVPTIVLRPNFIMAGTEPIEVWNSDTILTVMKKNSADKRTVLYSRKKKPWEKLEKAVKAGYRWVIPYGPGNRSWRWHVTDVRDVVQACILSLETGNKKAIGEIFNVAAEKPQKFSDVIKYLAPRLGEEYTEAKLPVLWDVNLDISKTKKMLKYKPRYDYRKMVDDAIRYRDGKDTGVIGPGIPH